MLAEGENIVAGSKVAGGVGTPLRPPMLAFWRLWPSGRRA